MRFRALGAILLVTSAACGAGSARSVSTQQAAPAAATIDPTAVAARWKVVKTAAGETHFRAGDIVELRPGGEVASGSDPAPSAATWALTGSHFELRDGATVAAYSPALNGDVLKLVGPSGQSDVLRRYPGQPGQPTAPSPAGSALGEAQFLSLVARGRVESATLTQSGPVITVTGVYDGDERGERYAVTLTDCKRAQGLGALFRSRGVLTDGLPPAEVEC